VATARPGWSRRAQYGLFFSFLAVIAGIIVGLILLTLSLVAPSKFQLVRGAALDVTGPVAGSLHGVIDTAEGVVTGADNYWDAASQNAQLKRDNKAMLQRMVEAKAIFGENQQLKATLQLREHERSTIATGRIVGSSFNSPRRFAILSAGSGDGVRIGMPVRSPDGLVGRIIDTGTLASRVLLVSDRANIVPARLLRNGIPVIAQGRGDGTIDVRPLEVGRNPFKRGDIIITSGTGGLYPPLVPIGRVVKLDDDGAVALPLADPANTSFAIVEAPFEPAAIAAENAPVSPPGTP
jgi:rod shape-determining protein MreC